MTPRAPLALHHVSEAIEKLQALFSTFSDEAIRTDWIRVAALERLVEIISEASRRIDPAWKSEHPISPLVRHCWDRKRPAARLRYHSGRRALEPPGERLRQLETAVLELLEKYDPAGLDLKRRLFPR